MQGGKAEQAEQAEQVEQVEQAEQAGSYVARNTVYNSK